MQSLSWFGDKILLAEQAFLFKEMLRHPDYADRFQKLLEEYHNEREGIEKPVDYNQLIEFARENWQNTQIAQSK